MPRNVIEFAHIIARLLDLNERTFSYLSLSEVQSHFQLFKGPNRTKSVLHHFCIACFNLETDFISKNALYILQKKFLFFKYLNIYNIICVYRYDIA